MRDRTALGNLLLCPRYAWTVLHEIAIVGRADVDSPSVPIGLLSFETVRLRAID